MFQLERAEQKRLHEYCRNRMEQLKEYAPVLEFFRAEQKLAPYLRGLSLMMDELEGKNDSQTKLDNVFLLLSSQGCSIFFDDLNAIVQGKELPLPDDPLEIPKHLAELERQKEEAERKRQEAQREQERKQLEAMWRQREIEERERKKAELCAQLGISPKALAKLQEG